MGASVEIDLAGMDSLLGDEAMSRAQRLLTQRVCDDFKLDAPAGGYVPRDTGTLQDTVEVSGDREVTWPAEYADAVYSGTERMAARPWFEQAKGAMAEGWAEYVGRAMIGK